MIDLKNIQGAADLLHYDADKLKKAILHQLSDAEVYCMAQDYLLTKPSANEMDFRDDSGIGHTHIGKLWHLARHISLCMNTNYFTAEKQKAKSLNHELSQGYITIKGRRTPLAEFSSGLSLILQEEFDYRKELGYIDSLKEALDKVYYREVSNE